MTTRRIRSARKGAGWERVPARCCLPLHWRRWQPSGACKWRCLSGAGPAYIEPAAWSTRCRSAGRSRYVGQDFLAQVFANPAPTEGFLSGRDVIARASTSFFAHPSDNRLRPTTLNGSNSCLGPEACAAEFGSLSTETFCGAKCEFYQHIAIQRLRTAPRHHPVS